MGVPLPIGDTLTDPKDYWLTDGCAAMMDRAAKAVVGQTRLPSQLLRCLAAQQYYTCTLGALEADRQAINAGNANARRTHVIAETAKTAARFVRHMCQEPIASSPELREWARKITEEADRATQGKMQ